MVLTRPLSLGIPATGLVVPRTTLTSDQLTAKSGVPQAHRIQESAVLMITVLF